MNLFHLIWRLLLCASLLAFGSSAVAASEEGPIEEVVVTGSYIKRDINQQAQPVDVFDRSTFENQGSPQTIEIIQNTPSISGTLNQSEQYQGSGVATGLKNINMRGLRADRTLILMNGKRMVVAGASVGKGGVYVPDVGNFPQIAMERVELLKNGGAVTYGTDAIAGVWNYITRDEFQGFEINVMHQALDHSDGDNTIGAIRGVGNEDANWVTSVEWEERNVLSIPDRDLARYNAIDLNDPDYWPLGRSSFGNPGTFNNFDTAAGGNPKFVDPGCGYSYMPFANIIDDQERVKIFSQMKYRISDRHELYGEVLWSRLETVYEGSPSYPPTNPDAGNFTWIPDRNPGFDSLLSDLESSSDPQDQADAAVFRAAGGANWFGRSLAGEGPAVEFFRRHETMRIIGGLRGDLTDSISYDLNVNWSNTLADIQGTDVLTDRWNHAVSGFGGAFCDRPDTGSADYTNGVGAGQGDCQYIFPVSMAIGASPGDPFYNDQELRDWFTGESSGLTKNRLMVTNLVLSGGTNWNLPGGEVLWAAGGQYRW